MTSTTTTVRTRRTITTRTARRELRAAGWTPTGPYPGRIRDPWPARCTGCGRPGAPRLQNAPAGGCADCRAAARAEAGGTGRWSRRPLTGDEAEAVMGRHRYRPLAPYPGRLARWRCQCLRCGAERHVTLNAVVQGSRCADCIRRGLLRPAA